ncbi:MAG: hypothetical protein EBQ73_03005 [Gammaproteobacteria bacterium]|nr:hypothetical protein [Gammaproteobacteria bacterium]
MKDEKRRARLVELLSRLESVVDVATRDMKSVLTEDEFKKYEELWGAEKSNRKIDKPPAIKKYELMIKQAYAADARFEKIRRNGGFKNDLQKTRMSNVSEHLSERAYEYYVELVQTGYEDYFVDASRIHDPHDAHPTPKEIPILKGSKSGYHYSKSGELGKRYYKNIILQEALDRLDGNLLELSNEEALKELSRQFYKNKKVDKRKLEGFKV